MDTAGTGQPPEGDTVLRAATPRAYVGLLKNRPFRNLTLATLTSAVGDWMGFFAIITLTADILGPGNAALFAVSGVMVARVLPSLLLGTVAGVLVDRWDRKRVLIATDLGRGLVMALIPFTNEIFTLVLATLVIEVLSALFAPAKDAVFPSLVRRDELVLANQVNLISTYGTLPIGALSNALLTAVALSLAPEGSFLAERPIALPIWINALSYWVSAPLLAKLVVPPSARRGTQVTLADGEEGPGPWEQLLEGFRFIGRQPVIRALILGVMVAFAAAGVVISVGEFFARVLNSGPSGFGILVGVVGVGLVVGLGLSAPLSQRLEPERLFAPGIGVAGVSLLLVAVMPSLAWAAVPALAMGVGAGVSFIVGYTVLQQRAGDAIRGRTFAAFNSGVRVALFGATVAVPLLVGAIGRERPEFGELPDGGTGIVYPYAFGGIRISLLLAGALALTGGVLTGRALHRALVGEPGLDLPSDAEPLVRHGLFIAFEGGDGAGKSTQIRLLRSAIERAGWDAIVTREPGGTAIGETIRELLLSHGSVDMSDRAEALLYAAARAQHVDEVIRPAIEKGQAVLCDRYIDSSIVYQGAARGLGERAVADLNAWATGELRPDLVVLLDVDPNEGLRRATHDGTAAPDRLEVAGIDFHRAVVDAYRRQAQVAPDRYLVLDASRPVEALHAAIRSAVLDRLGERDRARLEDAPVVADRTGSAAPSAGEEDHG